MIKKLKTNTAYIYTIVLFLLSIGLFIYIYPKEKQFNYENIEGGFWRYEDLVSDGDYPILKSEKSIFEEQNNIKNNFVYYYYIDTTIYDKIIANIIAEISYFEATKLNIFFKNNKEIKKNEEEEKIKAFKQSIQKLLKKEYSTAIVTSRDSLKKGIENTIKIKNHDIYELNLVSDLKTTDEVKSKIRKTIYKNIEKLDSLNSYAIHNIIYEFINSENLIFDENYNEEMLDNQLNQISLYSGFINNGDKIIKKGDKIDSEKYQKIMSIKNIKTKKSLTLNNFFICLGVAILFFVLYFIVYLLNFYINKKDIFLRLRNNTFFSIQLLIIVLFIFVILKFGYVQIININTIPYTLIAALMICFFDFNISFFVYFLIILLSAFFAPNGFEFIFTQSMAGMVCMYSMKSKQLRSQTFIVLFTVVFSYIVIYSGFYIMKAEKFTLDTYFSYTFFSYLISASCLLLFMPLLYVYEKSFGFVTNFTLIELSDTNSPLLKKLAEKSPGTFNHSIQVANIVESAVRELKGNVLLARVGALYHDVGKIAHPEYFIENQHGINIHDNLTLEISAQKIIEHVSHGLEIADKYHLPYQIKAFISSHHGTTITRYFYNTWKNQNSDKSIDITLFQYPGPKPKSLESAAVMMADSIEAASRTLKQYTEESINNVVNNIIDNLIANNQFDEVDISLKEIKIVKTIFVKKLIDIYHSRIVYPDTK